MGRLLNFGSISIFNMFALSEASQYMAAGVVPQALENTWQFFIDGGVFMGLIVACSMVGLAAIVYKVITLPKASILPDRLSGEVERIGEDPSEQVMAQLENEFLEGESALARLCAVATKNTGRPQAEIQDAVQASAREEIVKMHVGMSVLDVVITVAPLLGLLGTASGLVVIFGNTEDLVSGMNNTKIGSGIARALGTTIAGLVVAVPAVVAHSYFSRKIEKMAARLEVLLGIVISACQVRAGESTAAPLTQLSQLPQ